MPSCFSRPTILLAIAVSLASATGCDDAPPTRRGTFPTDAASESDAHVATDACVASAEVCNDQDDDCDGEVDEGVLVACLFDVDGDHHPLSDEPLSLCRDPSRPTYGECPPGYQSVAGAGTLDCDDANPAAHAVISVRLDADGDGYCVGTATTVCAAAPSATYRLSATCASTTDCRDSNAFANVSCTLAGAFTTNARTYACGVGGPPSSSAILNAISLCPQGFSTTTVSPVNSAPTEVNCSIQAVSFGSVTVLQTCIAPFGTSTCFAAADCVAN